MCTAWVKLHLILLCCNHLSASEDYGKSFEDVTNLINNTFIRSEFGIAIGPENSGKVSHAHFNVSPHLVHLVFLCFLQIMQQDCVNKLLDLWLLGDPDS